MSISTKSLSSNLNFKLAVALLTITILGIIVTGGDVIVEEGKLNVSQDLIADTNTLYVDSTNNRVGIGTTSPSSKLDVAGNLEVDGSDFFVNATSGNVGIGTVGPLNKLHLYTSTAGAITSLLKLDGPFTANDGTEGTAIEFVNSADPTAGGTKIAAIRTAAGALSDLVFFVRGDSVSKMRITSSGNVGIGEVAPGAKLSVSGGVAIGSAYDTTAVSDGNLIINGKVGIGTTSPNATLTIKVGGTTIADEWTVRSDRDIKTDITELNVDDFDFSKASLYKYKIKYEEPVYEEIDGELVQVDTEERETREHIGLMKDEVPEECARDNGIDLYCLISLQYAKIKQLEAELCNKDNSYSWCK